jgi:hypothetical protein
MRRVWALLLPMVPCVAAADRLVDIPIGRKLLQGTVRVRATAPLEAGRATQVLVGSGVLESYDVDVVLDRETRGRWRASLDVSFNFAPPITDIAPGVSVGVLDIANRAEGRAAYLAFTQRFGNYGELNQNTPTEVTLGVWSRGNGLVFVGASLPLWDRLLVLAEATGQGVTAGFEARPARGLSLRFLTAPEGPRLQASLQLRL